MTTIFILVISFLSHAAQTGKMQQIALHMQIYHVSCYSITKTSFSNNYDAVIAHLPSHGTARFAHLCPAIHKDLLPQCSEPATPLVVFGIFTHSSPDMKTIAAEDTVCFRQAILFCILYRFDATFLQSAENQNPLKTIRKPI
jgi:hypothetical protein